jgi:hypothetical protein
MTSAWFSQHRLPGILIVPDAQPLVGPNQGQAEQLGLPLDAPQQIGIGHLELFQSGVHVGLAFAVEQSVQTEPIDEPLVLAGRHGFLVQVHELNHRAALLEEPFRGAGRLRVL